MNQQKQFLQTLPLATVWTLQKLLNLQELNKNAHPIKHSRSEENYILIIWTTSFLQVICQIVGTRTLLLTSNNSHTMSVPLTADHQDPSFLGSGDHLVLCTWYIVVLSMSNGQ